ncbi:MAG: hypothetical protein KGS45_06080 [Planctomycetes bacterium]|nr:hypothetical protein [Planctomycetota bacterium]
MNQLLQYRLLCVGACLVPVAGAAFSRFLPIGRGPSTAAASTQMELPASFRVPAIDGATQPTAATQAIEALRSSPYGKTPVWVPVQADPSQTDLPINSVPEPTQPDAKRKSAVADLKTVEVTSILTGRQPLAVIAGKPRKVGDEIPGGWRITGIDPSTGTVDVQHGEVGSERLHLKKKTIEDSAAGSSGVRSNPSR